LDYDQLAADYARHRRLHPGVLQALLSAVDRGSRVLEVGCGTGNYIAALASVTGCACWGIDPSDEMLAQARARSNAVDYRTGGAERLDFPADSFDLVYSVDVIHHVADRDAYLREAQRVLASAGRMCTATDSAWIIRHREPLATYFPETVEADLARYPRIPELCAKMARAGFDPIEGDQVECPYPVTSASPYRDRAYSVLHLISEQGWASGVARMEEDLRAGPIQGIARYVLLWGTATAHPGPSAPPREKE